MIPFFAHAALTACAGQGGRPTTNASSAAPIAGARAEEPDPLAPLVAALPRGADRCVLARPARIDRAQRARVARLSQAEPLAWLPQLEVQAYAVVARERRDGPRAQVTLLQLAPAVGDVRRVLDEHAGVNLEWNPAPCETATCGPRARLISPLVVRIEQGVFPAEPSEGAERLCVPLAERSRRAVEVASMRGRSSAGRAEGPLRASTTLHADAAGLRVSKVELMDSMPAAADAGRLALENAPLFASGVRVELADLEVRTEYLARYEDIALVEADEARLRAADAEAELREAVGEQPPLEDPPRSREDLLAALGYLLERAARADGDAKRAELLAAKTLLERAVAQQPDDEGLSLLLAELCIAELADAARARAVLAPFARSGPGGLRALSLLRQAAALEGDAALARELLTHGLVPRAKAQAVARDILARVRAGSGYSEAEQAALAAP